MTDAPEAATLPGNLSADAQSTLTFYTGVTSTGAYSATNGWLYLSDHPHKWGEPTAGASGGTVYYYFDPAAGWSTAEQGIFQAVMALWSDVANITFVQTTSAADADYTLSRSAAGDGTYTLDDNTAAAGQLSQTQTAQTEFDTSPSYWSELYSFTNDGGYGVDTVIHEMGHMLGLSHTGNYNGGATSTDQRNSTDSQQYSIMSYFDPAVDSNGPFGQYASKYAVQGTKWGLSGGYGRTPTTWMPLDILAVQRLYGTPTVTALSGGQVFGFHSNIAGASAPFFDFTKNTTPVITIWDAGTGNTLDVSGFSQGGTVDLVPGTFSSLDGLVNNIGIAYGTSIDTAVLGSGSTLVIANADADAVAGGGGADTVQFATAGQSYTQSGNLAAQTIRLSAGVVDTLTAIATLAFTGSADTVALLGSAAVVLQGNFDVVLKGASTGGSITATGTGDSLDYTTGGAAYRQSGGLAAQTLTAASGGAADALKGVALTFSGGADTVTLTGSSSVMFAGSGNNSLISSGGSQIIGGAGSLYVDETTRAQSAGDLISIAAGGSLLVQGGTAVDTIQSGSVTTMGGSFVIGNATATGGPVWVVTLGDSTTISFANIATL